MATETERKFLVTGEGYRKLGEPVFCRQGYLSTEKERIVRVRVKADRGFLTVKGVTSGIRRTEFEYEIPAADAERMLEELCEKPIIEKYRYNIEQDGLQWDVDEFVGVNEGLVLAEVQVHNEDQDITLPQWVGREVSNEPKYFNSSLVHQPYSKWS
jgi:adenylate cyclase